MTHFIPSERDRIAELYVQGFNFKEIADDIKRHPSSVSREVRRNRCRDGSSHACNAQRLSEERRVNRPFTPKAERPEINQAIRRGLAEEHAPEQIAERLKFNHPDDPSKWIGESSIYRWIEASDDREYWKSRLRCGGKAPRKPRENRPNSQAAKIKDRPAEIENRERIGDFEGDTILGKQGTGGIVTLVDRKSRYTIAFKVEDKRSETIERRIREELAKLADQEFHSMTFDNGGEFAKMPRLGERLEIAIYCADPGKPYQRGTNENTNRLLRQYFPKGIDFTTVSHQEVRDRCRSLNNRPRKCLGWRTPHEVFFSIGKVTACV
jgi:IS30 family transposase